MFGPQQQFATAAAATAAVAAAAAAAAATFDTVCLFVEAINNKK